MICLARHFIAGVAEDKNQKAARVQTRAAFVLGGRRVPAMNCRVKHKKRSNLGDKVLG